MQLGCYSVILLVWGTVGILSCFIVLSANTLRAFAFTALSRVLHVAIPATEILLLRWSYC